MYWFQLWREFKLSIAELLSVFPGWKIELVHKHLLFISWIEKEDILNKAHKIWWTIKIIDVIKTNNLNEFILKKAEQKTWKFNYWISVFWMESNLKKTLNDTKRYLSDYNISSRFVNKNFENISSVQIIGEKLIQNESDFTILREKDCTYIGYTIWTQDVDAYSKRDYSKARDMRVGMLPPKLSQMMINLAGGQIIYDPFVWLWTILIESIAMWNDTVYGSDFNPEMITATTNNVNQFSNSVKSDIFLFDARDISQNNVFENKIDSIVTEWFLWEIMTKNNINQTRINVQRNNLSKLYEKFFFWLKSQNFKWTIVISFPFWEIDKKYHYFEEIYEIVNKYCNVLPYFSDSFIEEFWREIHSSRSWSLLYKRKNQLVWREIFKLTIK